MVNKTLEEITGDMLRNTRSWTLVTHLCMKHTKRKGMMGIFPLCAIIVEHGYRTDRIVVRNHPDKMDGEFIEEFNSIDALLAAGWVVD